MIPADNISERVMSAITPTMLHQFWFGTIDNEQVEEKYTKMWFSGGEALDTEVRTRFAAPLEQAARGELDAWQASARDNVALIVLLDQFPLNMYRRTARAFAYESHAIAACKHGLEQGQLAELFTVERNFFLMPLMHSESDDDQALSIRCYTESLELAPPALRESAQLTLDFALKHKQTIDEFGRYPYRNAVLGRESSAAELAYLADNPSRYGQ